MVADYRKFDKMTKPIKHRNIKRFIGLLKSVFCSVRISFYDTLSKIGLIKKFKYQDDVTKVVDVHSVCKDFKEKYIETDCFKVYISCSLEKRTSIDQEYYWKPTKSGGKKILFVVKDKTHIDRRMVCNPTNPLIIIDGKYFSSSTKFVYYMNLPTQVGSPLGEDNIIKYNKISYDLSKLENYRAHRLLTMFSPEEITYAYETVLGDFLRIFGKISLEDIKIVEE